ncbi:MAG: paraquat-inducible protein A [Flavobacteriales bacterium]|nr:paraquat-inducible protein A [Flavobacteriales bacterium]
MMKRFGILILSTASLLVGTVLLTFLIQTELNDYADKRDEIVDVLNAEDRLGNLWEWIPLSGVGEEKVEEWHELERQADGFYDSAITFSYYLLVVVGVYVLINLLVYKSSEERLRVYGFVMLFSALSFLYLGLNTPFLEIEAFKDDISARIPIKADFLGIEIDEEISTAVEGRVYFLYQNKSVLQLIKLLYTGGNIPVAIIILIFSILFPAIKLITSIFLLTYPKGKKAKSIVNLINKIGKWSMADVMVASIFLAYFSFSNMNVGVDTGSSTLIGLYFFLAFVVLSIFSGAFIKRFIQKNYEEQS